MLGPPGPRVSGRKHPPPQLPGPCALDPGEQVSRTTNWKAASSKHLPRADFSGKGRRHSALGPTCQHPVGPHSQDSEGSNSPSPAEVLP